MQIQLVDDLLDVSRIVAGKLKVDLRPVDLCAIVKAAVEVATAAAQAKSIRLDVVLDESIAPVAGDPSRLHQVVSNLLVNAIKFTADGGQVRVSLDSADGGARIKVSDTGTGIEPGFLPHVFDRFSQEDNSNTRAHTGLGLGLAIVRHLVEQHGGRVLAESPGTGKGATFTVTLPIIKAPLAREAGKPEGLLVTAGKKDATTSRDERLRQMKDLRVLIVDDDRATGWAVSEMLRELGAEVRVAESAAEAMTAVEKFKPRVLLCDIAMPDEDGYSFIRRLRALGRDGGGETPALALTALAAEDDQRRSLAAGFQMHMTKPVDIEILSNAVVELAESQPAG
jgi:two-component system CheB/CheR fusion protein